jgi:hypothetical protein
VLSIEHRVYAGAYGRPLPAGAALARALDAERALTLDGTYGEKGLAAAALAAAAGGAGGETLFWVTFDARALGAHIRDPRDPVTP